MGFFLGKKILEPALRGLAYLRRLPMKVNQTVESRVFPAKLLLFGEHVLLLGAPALAIPVAGFGGHWAMGTQPDRHFNRMRQFAGNEALKSVDSLDTEQFLSDLEAGLYFDSNIPTGYGLGSSGALCAAIYERYVGAKTTDLPALKAIFAQMESFFHGNSSGIDPLTSYVGAPLLIQNKTEVQRAVSNPWNTDQPCVFLLDSELPRRTGPLVEWFLAQSKQADFAQKLSEEYLPAHSNLLNAWLAADPELFWPNLRRVSRFQFEHFEPMIPANLRNFWAESLDNQDFTLKICGAGGGGFVLGFAKDAATAQALTQDFLIAFP